MELRSMLRAEGVQGNGKGCEFRLPEKSPIEKLLMDGTILPTTQGIKCIRRSRSRKRGGQVGPTPQRPAMIALEPEQEEWIRLTVYPY